MRSSSRSCLSTAAYKSHNNVVMMSSSYIQNDRNSTTVASTTIIRRKMSDLPHHLVVGMPALSPTMASGTVSEWKIDEGSAFQAGDSIAEIQTDKASIAFEAQDDGFIAKYLVQPGTEVNVGDPILVTVEDEEYVAAFANFVPPPKEQQQKEEAPKEQQSKVVAPPVASAPVLPPVTAAATPPPAAPMPPPPPPVVVAAAPPISSSIPDAAAASSLAPSATPMWGRLAKSSPIAKVLSASQQKYIDIYGSTGQKPL